MVATAARAREAHGELFTGSAPAASTDATVIASLALTASVVAIGATPRAGMVCESCTVPVTPRAPPIESCQSMPARGTPKPFGFVTSSWRCPDTPPKPADDSETSRTLAFGFSIERRNIEQPEVRAHAARAIAKKRMSCAPARRVPRADPPDLPPAHRAPCVNRD
ncbi:MAG TPA: hypothetical protein VN253_07565 [Kofleriaceae bacterium]|nr:hypothetical protein [Kofleriaceae bacterium]